MRTFLKAWFSGLGFTLGVLTPLAILSVLLLGTYRVPNQDG